MADTDLTKIDLYEYTLADADMADIDENALYSIKDMPTGGITNAEMVLALQPSTQGIFKVGSVYMCTDTVANQYIEKHFYKFTGDDWEDVTGAAEITVDPELSPTSTNPVENRVITNALNNKLDKPVNPTRNSVVTMTAQGAVTTTALVHESATAWSVPLRDNNGCIKAATPIDGTDAANKSFVESAIQTAVYTALNTPV